MNESAHLPLHERSTDISEKGAIRFGTRLWLDKEEQQLRFVGVEKPMPLTKNEMEIVRLLIATSHPNEIVGGIINISEFQHWFDEYRKPGETILTSENQVARHVFDLRKKLKLLTGDVITIENEGNNHGFRGYFLKEHTIDNQP